jgi:o-succinylbenzoate synthase
MIITDLRYHLYRIPLQSPFTTTHGMITRREGAIVEVMTRQGCSGIGEIAPLPEFGGDHLCDALAALSSLATQLPGKTLSEALCLLSAQHETENIPSSTIYGLESALLDALGKSEGRSIASYLATTPSEVRPGIQVNTVLGTATSEISIKMAEQARTRGFTCIKIKIGGDIEKEIARVAAVRTAIGPALHLRLDANEAWSFEQACTILTRCAAYNIQYVEQPLKAEDLAGMRKLRQTVPIPIAADEAVSTLESARRILTWRAADILIIKPQLVGGLRRSQQIIREAAEHGVQCVITSTLESGIGLLAALHLAAATPEITLACGLTTLPLLADDLLSADLPIDNGSLALPGAPGLGMQLDREALTKFSWR